ncbi:MAG: hypothetical protein HYX48_01070 [Chlamydiales bacterium]|nr:hypothetical protein [Chlamydiales bacterium]
MESQYKWMGCTLALFSIIGIPLAGAKEVGVRRGRGVCSAEYGQLLDADRASVSPRSVRFHHERSPSLNRDVSFNRVRNGISGRRGTGICSAEYAVILEDAPESVSYPETFGYRVGHEIAGRRGTGICSGEYGQILEEAPESISRHETSAYAAGHEIAGRRGTGICSGEYGQILEDAPASISHHETSAYAAGREIAGRRGTGICSGEYGQILEDAPASISHHEAFAYTIGNGIFGRRGRGVCSGEYGQILEDAPESISHHEALAYRVGNEIAGRRGTGICSAEYAQLLEDATVLRSPRLVRTQEEPIFASDDSLPVYKVGNEIGPKRGWGISSAEYGKIEDDASVAKVKPPKVKVEKKREAPVIVAAAPAPAAARAEHVEITPSARGCNDKVHGPFITGDYIFWQVNQDGTLFAEKLVVVSGSSKRTLKEMESSWNSGFKAGIGYNLPYDGWDIYLNWTWLPATITNRVSGEEEEVVSVFENDESSSHAKAHLKFRYNTLDLEIGRNLFLSPNLNIRPVIGLRGASIDQNLTVRYSENLSSPDMITREVEKVDFFAMGPRLGLETRWGAEWGVFGDLYASILFGKRNVKAKGDFVDMFGDLNHASTEGDASRVRPNLQLRLGADWDRCFCKNRHINLSAAYEMEYWWNQWQSLALPNYMEQGDLVLQGLTVQARFDY